jgi:hypothetical protein
VQRVVDAARIADGDDDTGRLNGEFAMSGELFDEIADDAEDD